MESLLFMLNAAFMVVFAIMGLRDDRTKPGAPRRSWFRYADEQEKDRPAEPARRVTPGWRR